MLKISLLLSVIVGLAVVLIDLKLLLLLVIGLMVFALFLVRFDLGVFVFVVFVPLTMQLPAGIHHLISYSLSGMLVFSWLIRKLVNAQTFASLNRGVLLFMIFYTLWGLVCSLHSDYLTTGLFVTLRQLLFFVIFYVLYDWMKSEKEINLIVNAMIAMGVIASLPAITQMLSAGLSDVFRFGSPMRFGGIYTSPNFLGLHLSFILGVAVSKFLYVDLPKKRWFPLVLILIISAALFFTFSRAAWLLAFVSISIILFLFKGGRVFISTTVVFFTLILLVFPEIRESIEMILRLEVGVTNRDVLWKGAIGIISAHPIFGTGPGTFKHVITSFVPVSLLMWSGGLALAGDSHNFFLTKGVELGLVGVFLILCFFVNYFKIYFRNLKKVKILKLEYIFYGAGATIIGAIARSFFEGGGIMTGGAISFDLFFWLMIAFTLKVNQLSNEKSLKQTWSIQI
ncbi:MAG: O-antigen ligase family protein [candidate division Zixibacteria bacterium]|nr:O-antigen ligase family protein [candidate division Zixibacteria bacterium]